mmetsp:Transcript_9790/g.23271  ORF Transcript_9790/g.23271 Transcript_9790/m.23271 type:complete len:230 (+) Transcript_9790:33-722(+)
MRHHHDKEEEGGDVCRVRPVPIAASADSRTRRVVVAFLGAALISLACVTGTRSDASRSALEFELTEKLAAAGSQARTNGQEVDLSLLPADEQRKALGVKYRAQKNPHERGLVRTYDKMLSNGPFAPPTAKLVREANGEASKGVTMGGKLGSVHLMRSAGQILASQLQKEAAKHHPASSAAAASTGGGASAEKDASDESSLAREEGKLKAQMRALEEKAGSEELSGADVA